MSTCISWGCGCFGCRLCKKLYIQRTKWDSINAFDALGGQTVTKGDNLFPRLKAEDEVTYIKNLMGGNN